MNKQNPTEDWTNRITRCTRCESTILWDDFGRPQILKLGTQNLLDCMENGCNLLFLNVPSQCCDKQESYMLKLGLQQLGIPEEDAAILALQVSKGVAAA